LHNCCGSSEWVRRMTAARPFPSWSDLIRDAEAIWNGLAADDWREAFAAHPRIGSKQKGKTQSAKSAAWSKGEQQKVDAADKVERAQLLKLNEQYFKKFGFIFIVFATGKTAGEMACLLEERLPRSKKAELETAAVEQMKITRLRLEKWLAAELEN